MNRDDLYKMDTLFPTVVHNTIISSMGIKLETVAV